MIQGKLFSSPVSVCLSHCNFRLTEDGWCDVLKCNRESCLLFLNTNCSLKSINFLDLPLPELCGCSSVLTANVGTWVDLLAHTCHVDPCFYSWRMPAFSTQLSEWQHHPLCWLGWIASGLWVYVYISALMRWWFIICIIRAGARKGHARILNTFK